MPESSKVAGKTPQWASDCKACQTIWQRFADPEFQDEVNFGTFEEALCTQCPTHKPLVQTFVDYIRTPPPTFPRPESRDMGITKGVTGNSVGLFESISKLGCFYNLLLVKDNSDPGHAGTGRVLDPDWADLEVLNEWKKRCLTLHGSKCQNPMKIWPTRPAWLVDVEQKCLVPGQTPGNFVALSYTNGNREHGIINTNILANLQKPYSLDSPELSEYLTPVIQHAIYLTSVIGERYLWVDSLCISQSDRPSTVEQLKLMGAIYASAIVTIISADDDAESGLKGLKGWTYQEYTMAQRRILFNRRELHWECQCSVWHEEMSLGVEADKYINQRLAVMLAGFPDLGALGHAISLYNKRKLRYGEDALPAISGLLSVLSRSFKGGFLYGLPEMFFEHALAWRPLWSHTSLRRRIRSDRAVESQLQPSGLPSWSWIGWQGLVTDGYGEAARINDRQHWIEETIPITEWYTSQSPSDPSSRWRRIRSTWYENRDSYKDFTKPLPPGWTRHDAPETGTFRGEAWLYPDGCKKYFFTHKDMPDTDQNMGAWYYPFPVADIQESTPPFTPEQTQYLFCKTSRAQLTGYQEGDGNLVKLRNSLGEDVGKLHLHSEESLSIFPTIGAEDEARLSVDLVAVCKMRKYSKTWNQGEKIYDLPFNKEDTYLVFWVEWKDGVAYRLANGRVQAAEWDKLDAEKVSLILG
ncbi:hypothetical protein B0J13DRAFT_599977 [Dactylonectria estremocensis]|uniref:Heterokaryon incompatibility domain-containing protein n=1 Tax=Dactylonectria estremocensis TaxID=1079267 RepID=A0A9P9DCA4_9HYPO|nr:hypothetical protein B0J13DRAFT_599977 [Dactylonectria estremocensis]